MESVIVAAVDFEHTVRESTGMAMTGIPQIPLGISGNENKCCRSPMGMETGVVNLAGM